MLLLLDIAFEADADVEQVLCKPVVDLGPTRHDGERRAAAEQGRNNTANHTQKCQRIENCGVKQRPCSSHQISAQTARRRRRYLLYSPNNVTNVGSVGTASVTSSYFFPRAFLNS